MNWRKLFEHSPAIGFDMCGAELWFYEPEPGSNVLANVFMDEALQIPHSNPVIADAIGRFPPIFMDMSKRIEGRLKNSRGVLILSDSDARSWCGPIASLAHLRRIEAAAREVVECEIPSNDQHGGSKVEMLDELREKAEALRTALDVKES